ncbi:MAG: aminopeptidase P family protein [Clostridia bacterium]|nr:aminopeptidase P family protein [Clostridia bacterium]
MSHLQTFQTALASLGIDGALISSEVNQRYLSDFPFSDGYLLVTPEHAYLLTDSRYAEAAREQVRDFKILLPKKKMTDTLAELISEHRIAKLALEEDSVSYSDYQDFCKALAPAGLLSGASKILRELRAVKTPDEIERIAKAQEITDRAFTHILNFISTNANVTEQEVALELEFFMRKQGSDGVAFDTIAVSGPASSRPHGVPSDAKLRRGFLTMDFGARVDGYCADMTRTVVIGKADEELKTIYSTVLAAQRNALEQIHEGMLCRDADELARSVIREAGYGDAFGHSLGHGVGLDVHEAPSLSPKAKEDSLLKVGNVVTVEPGIYLEGRCGCRIEDMVAITENGIRNFTKSTKELIEL